MRNLRKKKSASVLLSLALMLAGNVTALAGGALESFDITGAGPSPIAGHLLARVIGIRWDARCIPVQYRVNDTLDPISNPLGAPFLSVAAASAELQASMDQWNNIPTSFVDLQIVGTTSNPGLIGFDMVNEVTFRTAAGFGAIASSPSVSLIADVTLVDGDDIDGDGDSDVSALLTTAGDADSDGDIEFPPGFYKAGTILDNDVQFNTKVSNGLRFTVDPAQADTVTRSVDLRAVAVHEFGHSFGLSHVPNNQDSESDGSGATMFPLIDTGDPAAELAQGSPNIDDIAFASLFYPEGTGAGVASLGAGDVAFDQVFGLIKGELHHGVLNQPLAGGSLLAVDRNSNTNTVSAFSGTTNLSFNPLNGGLFFVPVVGQAIVNGDYVIPVPKGNYSVNAEAVDGSPVAAQQVNFTTQIGNFFGQQNFLEEFYNNNKEGAIERDPGDAKNVHVNPGHTQNGIDLTTNQVFNIGSFGARNAIGFINPPAGGFIYAMAFPASEISAILPGQRILVQAGLFDTHVVDASAPVLFANAMLTTGVINPDTTATIDLQNPLDIAQGFLAQDTDFAPFYFKNPHELGKRVRDGINAGQIQNLFLVLQIPNSPFAGVSGQPPLIGLNTTGTIFLRSFLSTDGGVTFNRRNTQNFRFSLVLAQWSN